MPTLVVLVGAPHFGAMLVADAGAALGCVGCTLCYVYKADVGTHIYIYT